MKSAKKLITFILPASLLAEAKSTQKKYRIKTLSSLLRIAIEEASSLNYNDQEEKVQISFRVETEAYKVLEKLARKNKKSIAEIVRALLKNIKNVPEKKLAAGAKKTCRKKSSGTK